MNGGKIRIGSVTRDSCVVCYSCPKRITRKTCQFPVIEGTSIWYTLGDFSKALKRDIVDLSPHPPTATHLPDSNHS